MSHFLGSARYVQKGRYFRSHENVDLLKDFSIVPLGITFDGSQPVSIGNDFIGSVSIKAALVIFVKLSDVAGKNVHVGMCAMWDLTII